MSKLNRRSFFFSIFGAASSASMRPATAKPAKDEEDDDWLPEPLLVETVGTVISYDPKKGYGFIQPDALGSEKMFFHVIVLRASSFQTTQEGARVRFLAIRRRRSRGFEAFQVHSIDGVAGKRPPPLWPEGHKTMFELLTSSNSLGAISS